MEKLAIATLLWVALVGCNKGVEKAQEVPLKSATIIVTYDNNPYDDRLKIAWGFSCVVRCGGKSILFDTGGDSPTLLYNMEQLQIDPKEIDMVVLSHIHGDHVGGLSGFLKRNSNVTVYLPKSFPQSFKTEVESYGAKFEEVSNCLLYTSPSPRDKRQYRMPSSA